MRTSRLHHDRTHYVYLLVDRKEHRFKIGMSIDPVQRARLLGQDFNLSMSVQAGFTRKQAYELERRLHSTYRDLNIDRRVMGRIDGCTEWFQFDCFPACRAVLRDAAALVPLCRIIPAKPKKKDWVEECFYLLAKMYPDRPLARQPLNPSAAMS